MEKLPFVYLTSPPFSGSTLFSLMVNTHPDIATVGEMTGLVKSSNPDTYYCSCGERIRDCHFWQNVSGQMKYRHFLFEPGIFDTRFEFGPGLFRHRLLNGSIRSNMLEDWRDRLLRLVPQHRKRLDYLVARNKALAESILQVTGRSVFFDASKNPRVIRHFFRDPTIDLRIVHLVRDVRGTSLSRRKNKGETNWRRAVNHWVRANRNIESQLHRMQVGKWIRIRYEDVCRAPEATLQRFFKFCGLEPHALPLDFGTCEHHIVGNRMRLSSVGQIRLDEEWRRVLTPAELALAAQLANSLHIKYGYAPMASTDLAG